MPDDSTLEVGLYQERPAHRLFRWSLYLLAPPLVAWVASWDRSLALQAGAQLLAIGLILTFIPPLARLLSTLRFRLTSAEVTVHRGRRLAATVAYRDLLGAEIVESSSWPKLVLTTRDGGTVALPFGSFDLERAKAVVAELEARRAR